jgi:hypothetical protein
MITSILERRRTLNAAKLHRRTSKAPVIVVSRERRVTNGTGAAVEILIVIGGIVVAIALIVAAIPLFVALCAIAFVAYVISNITGLPFGAVFGVAVVLALITWVWSFLADL